MDTNELLRMVIDLQHRVASLEIQLKQLKEDVDEIEDQEQEEPSHAECSEEQPCKVVPGLIHPKIGDGYRLYLENKFGSQHNDGYGAREGATDLAKSLEVDFIELHYNRS